MEVSRHGLENAAIECGQRATPEVAVGDLATAMVPIVGDGARQERPSAPHTSSGENDHRGALGAAMLFDRMSHSDEEATVIVVSTIGPLLADRSEVRGDAVIAVNGGSGGNEVDGAGLG
jgi:hypothetical protein